MKIDASREPRALEGAPRFLVDFLERLNAEEVAYCLPRDGHALGELAAGGELDILVAPGDHFFLSGNVGTTLLRAQVEAGKRYYALLDIGSMILRVRLTPVTRLESDKLDGWLNDVELVEVNPDTVTPGVREREDMVAEFLQSAGGRARIGEADFTLLSSEHAY